MILILRYIVIMDKLYLTLPKNDEFVCLLSKSYKQYGEKIYKDPVYEFVRVRIDQLLFLVCSRISKMLYNDSLSQQG